MLPAEWHIQEEMYNFKSDPRAIGATVVLSANESSYVDTGARNFNQGTPHPSAWFQEHGAGVESGHIAGRSFYTSLGHLNETWQDELFLSHVFGGITWVLDSGTTKASNPAADLGQPSTTNSSSPNPSNTSSPSPSSATRGYPRATVLVTTLIATFCYGLADACGYTTEYLIPQL